MISLFTDFSAADIYVGQVKMVLGEFAPEVVINDLFNDAPNFKIEPSAHLLASLSVRFPPGTVFLCVVDPGVGSSRDAVVVLVDTLWFVGPDNGLLSVIAARHSNVKFWRVTWLPEYISHSFHGRDLLAPIAAWIAKGEFPTDKLESVAGLTTNLAAGDLSAIIYIDHYGNALTGIRAEGVNVDRQIAINGFSIGYARIFSDVDFGQPFWYENSIGLIEIAVNCGNAAEKLGLQVGVGLTIN